MNERDALDVETFMRQDLRLGENVRCVQTHLGPRRIRAKFVPLVGPKGSLTSTFGRVRTRKAGRGMKRVSEVNPTNGGKVPV